MTRNSIRSALSLAALPIAAFALSVALVSGPPPANAIDTENPDWPCVQRKVETLTSAQLWDGPPVEDVQKWWEDPEVRKLVDFAVSRRNPIEEVEARIEKLASETPQGERDKRMVQLFAGVLDETNKIRRRVIEGIERFQKRQVARAEALERKGEELADLHQRADKGEDVVEKVDRLQVEYDWDARVFKERQDNLPLACEIPVEIEQRAFAIAQTIRFQMSE